MPYADPDALVSTEFLATHLDDPSICIVDGSFKMPGVTPTAAEDYARQHIPGAVFFDINAIADHANTLPHMLPQPEKFAADMERLVSASLTTAERKTLIRLLKKIGYEAAASSAQSDKESAA